ncbi:MAG: TonB-dependent receptor [Opitutae bacterium]|nr:TonB-dependent receptor [Opitutae bacterium]
MTPRCAKRTQLRLRLISCVCFALGAAAISAAQTAAPTRKEDVVKLEKFVVTGSVLPTAAGESFSPVTVFSYSEMMRMGAPTPIEAVRLLPDLTGTIATEQRTNGGTGAAGVNLRGLGGSLTLFDGMRTAAFDNFNVIPAIAIDRIEIVKDGAGSVYGSDALSGVFNTIMVSRFEGVRTDAYYGNTTKNDAGVQRYGLLAGQTFGKTNLVFATEYYRRNALYSSDRAPSADADQRFRGGVNGGSPTFSGRATARVGSATAPVQDLVLAPGKTVGRSAADFVAFNPSVATSDQMLNFRQYTPSIPADERHSFYGRINQRLWGDRVEAHARLIYSNDRFYSGLAPSPMPTTGTAGTALRNAERLSPQIPTGLFLGSATDNASSPGSVIVGTVPFRTIALGPRQQVYTRHCWDIVTGLHGKLGGDWSWNLDFTYGDFYRDQLQQGAPGRTKLVAHILDGSYNPWALDTAKGVGPTGIAFDNPAALFDSAAKGNTHVRGTNRGGDFNVNGSLCALPAGEVRLGAGVDYYRTDSSSTPEPIFFSGDLLGLNGSNPDISRGFGGGVFSELEVPLFSPAMRVQHMHSLKLKLECRYDRQRAEGYQNGASGADIGQTFTAHNPKLGLHWQPTANLLVRGTWSTGFRLPSLGSLFAAVGTSNPSLIDPLGFPIPNQTQITTRGNPNLSPEKSKTYSVGCVYSPAAVSGLSVAVDYYFGEISGLVGEGAQYILNLNAAGQGPGFVRGNPATLNPAAPFASIITRAPATGSVQTIASTNFNISSRLTTGVDVGVTYAWPWRACGRLSTRLDWNTALRWDLTPVPGMPSQRFLGLYIDTSQNAISPGSIPRHKGYLVQAWEQGAWRVQLCGTYVGKLRDNPAYTQGNVIRWIEPYATLGVDVSYEFRDGAGWRRALRGLTVRVGANNVTDVDAPFSAGAFNDGYDVTTHSNRGRFVYTQLTKKF